MRTPCEHPLGEEDAHGSAYPHYEIERGPERHVNSTQRWRESEKPPHCPRQFPLHRPHITDNMGGSCR